MTFASFTSCLNSSDILRREYSINVPFILLFIGAKCADCLWMTGALCFTGWRQSRIWTRVAPRRWRTSDVTVLKPSDQRRASGGGWEKEEEGSESVSDAESKFGCIACDATKAESSPRHATDEVSLFSEWMDGRVNESVNGCVCVCVCLIFNVTTH